jgi:hypothetical protein
MATYEERGRKGHKREAGRSRERALTNFKVKACVEEILQLREIFGMESMAILVIVCESMRGGECQARPRRDRQ